MPHMKGSNPSAILVVGMMVAFFFMFLTPIGAQNTSISQAAIDEQTSERLTNATLNPEWLAYQKDRMAGKAAARTSAAGNSFGLVPSTIDLSHIKGKEAEDVALTYNPSFDLRTIGKVTSVKNQNPYGTCWAFATFGSLESYLLPAEMPNFSEYNLVMNSQFTRDNPMNDGGSFTMSTAYLARWGGPVNEFDDPYPGGDVHSAIDNGYTIQKHTQDIYFLPRTSPTDNNNVKWALTTKGGVAIGISWDDAYYGTAPGTYYNPSTSGVGHAVTIVGWDDNYLAANFHGSAGAPPGNGAFIVKNSWGTSWGNNGYFYLSYYDASIQYLMAVFTAEPASNYAVEYQYDPLGWVGDVGYSNPTCWAANVFTADGSAKSLTAVSFYTNDVNTQYEVYIYTNPTSGTPIGGTKNVGPTGTMPMPGYHTVKLTSPVPLSAGQKFSVVVKFTNPEYIYPVAYECAVDGYSMGATASLGQSYVSYDGSSWLDLASWESTSNVCIKAFTSALVSVPTVTNGIGVTSITSNSARLNGEIVNTGGEASAVRIYWGLSGGNVCPDSWDHFDDLGILGLGTFYRDISDLTPDTTYCYQCYASNSAGASWASQTESFKTKSESSPNTPSIPTGPASGVSGTSYSYSTSAIDPDGDQVKYTLNWGDGTTSQTGLVDSGTGASLLHTWSAAGTYLVKAMATDSKSAESAWSSALTVTITPGPNRAPNVPSIPSGPTSGVTGTTYSFSTSATDPNGDQVKYTFSWGDGTTTTTALVNSGAAASASHKWSTPGTYLVKARAKDSKGLASAYSNSLTVTIAANRAPNMPLVPSGSTSGITGTSYSYTTSATDPDGDPVKYTFNWGDGKTTTTGLVDSGTAASSSHSWTAVGTYLIKAKATDSKGLASAYSSSLTVKIAANSPPAIPSVPSGPTSGKPGNSYSYTTSATDPNGDQVKYIFSWGDGTTTTTGLVDSGTAASASHIWSTAGTYQVKAKSRDSKGATSALSSSLAVTISALGLYGNTSTNQIAAPPSSIGFAANLNPVGGNSSLNDSVRDGYSIARDRAAQKAQELRSKVEHKIRELGGEV